jgi:hypothetical protein
MDIQPKFFHAPVQEVPARNAKISGFLLSLKMKEKVSSEKSVGFQRTT